MKKIALLMTGQCRQSWLTAPSIYKNVIEPNNADVFLYLNKDSLIPQVHNEEEIIKKVFSKNVKSLIFTDDKYNKEVKQLIDSNYSKIDGLYKKLNRGKWDKQLNIHNTDQYFKVKKCCEAAVDYANKNNFKYDLILRVRPDIGWLNKFELLLPTSPDMLYVNYSLHDVSADSTPHLVSWVEDTCFFGSQDVMYKFCADFSDKMVDGLEICDERYDLSCATEKLLAKCLIDSGIKYKGINNYFDYKGEGWIRPKLAKYYVDWTKSPNFPLVEMFYEKGVSENIAVYFDRISEKDVVMDDTIILK
jgi:hypothetical protein